MTIVAHSLGLMLTTVLLLAVPPAPADPATQAEATLRRVAKMSAEQQKAWLGEVQRRFIWASRLTMKPEDAQKEQARLTALFGEKSLSGQALTELLVQLDQREKAAIARLVRQYRSQVYEAFPQQNRVLLERQEAWYRVWSQWEAAGSPADQQDRLMDWLAAAIRSSTPKTLGPLPPEPKFGDGLVTPPAVAMKPATASPQEKPGTAEPEKITAKPAAPPDLRPLGMELQRVEPVPLGVTLPDTRLAALEPATAAVLPHREEAKPAETIPHSQPPQAVVPPPKIVLQEAAVDSLDSVPPKEMPPRRAALPASALAAEPADLATTPRSQAGGSLDKGATAPPAAAAEEHVQVNIEELAARIAGVNLALRTLDAELNGNRHWTADQLDGAINRLDILILRQKDLRLFRDLLTAEEQARAGQIEPPKLAIASLAARIADARIRANGDAAAGDAQRQGVLRHLDELSDRLATLAAEK